MLVWITPLYLSCHGEYDAMFDVTRNIFFDQENCDYKAGAVKATRSKNFL